MPYFDTKVTAMPASFCGFYAPAVDCRHTRAGLAAGEFAIQRCQLMVQGSGPPRFRCHESR